MPGTGCCSSRLLRGRRAFHSSGRLGGAAGGLRKTVNPYSSSESSSTSRAPREYAAPPGWSGAVLVPLFDRWQADLAVAARNRAPRKSTAWCCELSDTHSADEAATARHKVSKKNADEERSRRTTATKWPTTATRPAHHGRRRRHPTTANNNRMATRAPPRPQQMATARNRRTDHPCDGRRTARSPVNRGEAKEVLREDAKPERQLGPPSPRAPN